MLTGSQALIVAVVATLLAVPAGVMAYTAFFDDEGADTDWSIEPTQDLVYTGSPQALVKSTITEGTIQYSTDGTNYSSTVPTGTNAGQYTIWCKVTKDDQIIGEKKISIKIETKPVTVKVGDYQKYYGDSDPEFTATVSGTIGNDSVSYTLSRDAGEDFGGYAIRVLGEEIQGNYRLVGENGYLIIFNQIAIVTPNDASKTVGSADPTLTATVEGGVNIKYTLIRESGEKAGTYKIHATGDRIQGNYLVEFGTGIFTIKEVPGTNPPAPTPSDDPKDNSTTEAIQGLIYNGSPQQLVKSTFTDETITYSLDGKNYSSTIPTGTNAGKYTVWYKVTKDSKTLTEKSITAYIDPKAVTVKATDYTKMYGESDPVFTATVTGTLGNDKVKYTLSREQGEDFGKYTINISANEVQGNYRLMMLTGQLTIYKVVKVIPDNASKQFGTADPVFTATVEGADNTKISYTLTRDNGEDLGAYKIHATGERAQGNYIVEYDSGIFSIMEIAASWETLPTELNYEFDGWEKELITPGTVSEGIAYYRLSTGNYSTAIPVATEPGIYKIYCKVYGGDSVADSTEIVLTSVISEYVWDGTETKEPQVVGGKYIIHLPSELAWISQNNYSNNGFGGSEFSIEHDLDLRGYEWTPIGSISSASTCPFRGDVEGNGHTIYNISIQSENDYVGLFGYVSEGSLANIFLDKVNVTGSQHVGGLAGFLDSNAENIRVYHADLNGNRYVGGIAGYQTNPISGSEISYANIVCDRIDYSSPYSLTYLGNDAGGISGMCNSHITDCSVTHLTINGYRNVGGIAGNIQENTMAVNISDCSIYRATIIANVDGGYADMIVGRASESTNVINASSNDTSVVYITTPASGGGSGEEPTPDAQNQFTGSYEYIIATIDGKVLYKKDPTSEEKTVLDIHQIILDNVTIESTTGPAIEIQNGAWLTIVIKNEVSLKGAKGADAIRVYNGGEVIITGSGTLTAIGNNEMEFNNPYLPGEPEKAANYNGYQDKGTSDYNKVGGSGIGFAGHSTGSIRIIELSGLFAYGYGHHAYGIGGDNGTVIISSSTINMARGGFDQPSILNGNYGKDEAEGAPAIGGASITITESTIEKALGGSKAAAIGAGYWRSTMILISNSNLNDIKGGNGSAGIGGSHPNHYNSANVTVDISIENSNITVTGGEHGAGIGSGYDNACGTKGVTELTIIISSYSEITAEGGKYAADIGTGYHSAELTGNIDNTVTVHVSEGTDVKTGATYSHHAQGIGYGVVDYSREAASLMDGSSMVTPSFTVNGVPITNPFDPTRWEA